MLTSGMADDLSHAPAVDLYEADFYAWTQDQAARLRALADGGGEAAGLDWARLAEEVGDMGKRDLNAVRSYVRRIIEHLYKLSAGGRNEPKRHWRQEIKAFRAEARDVLTTSIRAKVSADLEHLHEEALDIARAGFDLNEPSVMIDANQRWTLPQLLGEENDPLDQENG